MTLDREPLEDLRAISGTSEASLVAVGNGGTVLRYEDGAGGALAARSALPFWATRP